MTGESYGIENFGWHLAFACFRLASIAAGVYKRSLQGNASDKTASKYGPVVGIVSQLGLDLSNTLGKVLFCFALIFVFYLFICCSSNDVVNSRQ